MLKKLEEMARQLESFNLIFEDLTFEKFLRRYALETMLIERIPVNGKQTGYMKYLMYQKAQDMINHASLLGPRINETILIEEFCSDEEIKEMVRREHSYGISKSKQF